MYYIRSLYKFFSSPLHDYSYKHLTVRLLFLLAVACASLSEGWSQPPADSLLVLDGRLLSDDSLQPLANAHIISKLNRWGTITNDDGRFKMYVSPGDSVLLTSIGYRAKIIAVNDAFIEREPPVDIMMSKDTVLINEIIIRAFWDYETFKMMVVQMKPMDLDPYYPDWEGTELLYQTPTPLTFKGPIQALYDVFNESARLQRKLIRNRKEYNRLMILMGREQDTIPAIPEHMQETPR